MKNLIIEKRNLTIKRRKKMVACLGTLKIYIEDPMCCDLMINNVACRKLGTLKNGEEKTFQIDKGALKVFVIADTLSKNYCNEYYQLPEGGEDLFLSGENKFNPASGNAFRFDNNDNTETVANRKKSNMKGIFVLIIAIIIGALIGSCFGESLFSIL